MKISSGRWLRTILAGVLLASAGCLPGLTWLPDSSGLVYTTKKGELCLFDLATGKVEVVAKTDTETIWPAVSPDGKRFAVAKVQKHQVGKGFDTQYKTTFRVLVYDRRGKMQHESAEIDWGPARLAPLYHDSRGQVQLFWAAEKDTLLISGDDTSAIYDLTTKSLDRIPGSLLMVIGPSPVRPDHKGFLILKGLGQKEQEVHFMDWQGKGKKIEGALATLDPGEKAGEDLFAMLAAAPACENHWKGKTAVIRWLGRTIRIDTEKLTSTVTQVPPDKTSAGQFISRQHTFPDTKVRLRVVQVKTPAGDTRIPDRKSSYRIEALSVDGADPKVLVAEADLVRPFPSPDGKFLALRYFDQRRGDPPTGTERILVVNDRGEKVATLEIQD